MRENDCDALAAFIFDFTVSIAMSMLVIAEPEVKPDRPDIDLASSQDNNQIIKLSKEDTKLLEKYRKRISVDVDTKTGILTLATEMPDAYASAELALLCTDLLTSYVIDYKVSKAKENFDFVKARYEEAKINFQITQESLATFNDRNRNVVTALGQAESQRLQNEYNLAFEIYKGLATQLEQAKIKVKEETPVFTVLEPVIIPVDKNSPKRLFILVLFFFIGLIAGVIYILINTSVNK